MRKLLLAVGLLALVVCPLMRAQTNGLVLNQSYVFGPDGGHTFKIATLPSSNAGTYDHLHLVATINFNDDARNNLSLDALFGNRNVFSYSYVARGGQPNSLAKLAAYQNTDGSV